MILRIGVIASLLFLLLQFVRPELTALPVSTEWDAPGDVKHILNRACYACHSNETRLSWFDYIVPAYQLVARDVNSGRKALNFSRLGAESKSRQHALLFEALSQMELEAMPPLSYTRLHPAAKVSAEEISLLKGYLLTFTTRPAVGDAALAADRQYGAWMARSGARPFPVQPAPNGIAFLPDYRNWKVISSTDRADTSTLKMILGNETAIKAIADGRINPWPDGSAFAKVSWRQDRQRDGEIRTGPFEQVAFMIKDHKKYAASAGWGWAQWMGTELKPFGKDANFSRGCVACHAPLRQNDYVFTAPIAAVRLAP